MSMQGTEYFMSSTVWDALTDGNIHLQSPVGDLESFFHVFVWAILHNERSQKSLNSTERKYEDQLSESMEKRGSAEQKSMFVIPFIDDCISGAIVGWRIHKLSSERNALT